LNDSPQDSLFIVHIASTRKIDLLPLCAKKFQRCWIFRAGVELSYRAGWKMGVVSTLIGPILCVGLLLIGVLFFRDRFSPLAVVGLGFSIAGVALFQWSK
jgi:hypothetical protein